MTSRLGQIQPIDPEPTPTDFMEIGVPDDLPFSGGFGSQASELIDTSDVRVEQLREMYRKDGQVRSLYRVLSLPIRTLDPSFTPREGGSSDGEEEAEFVADAFQKPPLQGGMSSSFGRVLTGMTRALADGFSVFEKVWQITPEGQFTYRKFAPRDARTCRFLLDGHGGLLGVRQRTHWQGKYLDVEIPASKLLVYTCQHEENPWYGESMLLPAFYDYDTKTKLKYIANLAHQFHAVPGRVGSYPPGELNAKEKSGFRDALARFGFNTAMTKPSNYTVEEFGGQGSMPDFKAMLDYYDTQMAKSVLVQFMQLGTGSSTGSWSLSSDQSDLFTMALQAVADEMAEIFGLYAVPQLVDFNFGSNAYPDLTLGPLADATKEMMAEIFKEISDATTVNVTSEFLFELEAKVAAELGLEIDYDSIREEMRLRAEEERELAIAAQRALLEASQVAVGGSGGSEDDEEGDGAGNLPPGRGGPSVPASEVVALMEVLRQRARRRGRR